MPVYDYRCQQHGVFSDLATMDNSANPVNCPVCDEASSRVIMMSPELFKMAPSNRKAHQRNERSREAPMLSTPESRAEKRARHAHDHKSGCGCGSDAPIRGSKAVYMPDGSKIFPSARPWMISH